MKRLILSVMMCIFILFTGCSHDKVNSKAPKDTTGQTTLNTPSQDQPTDNENKEVDTRMDQETIAIKAMKSFYNNTESIIIYDQVAFEEDCILVLADRLRDGEHYPNLHLVSPEGKVLALTRHSYCWTLNYTQFRGYKIFFGLAGGETRQFTQDRIPVIKCEAVFGDKTEAVETRENIITHINPKDNDTRIIKSAYAYILPVKTQDMPENLFGVHTGGKKVSLPQLSIEKSLDYMPEYFKVKKQSLYNAFAFTYSPMLSPEHWKQVDSEGETALKGKTDANGNLNAIFLRSSPAVLKIIHSNQLPYDLKSFYLSNNYPWTATFSAGEKVAVVYSKDSNLFDCRMIKLTPQSIDKEIGIKDLRLLDTNKKNQVTLPNEPGYYLFLLRTEKYSELRSYMGVLRIQ